MAEPESEPNSATPSNPTEPAAANTTEPAAFSTADVAGTSSPEAGTEPVLLPISGSPAADSNGTATTPPTEEGLPEWEPLTPELVEEEAIRGDFVLRWAVVLLALLIGCRQLSDTQVLLQVKTGKYLASHGFWPPSGDVFSSSAEGRHWVNLSWLWDLISAGAFAIGDGIGLSLLSAVLVAATWWLLSQISRPRISDWFGSILAALALLACQHQFSAKPEMLTLLGTVLTLWILHRWLQRPSEPIAAETSAATDAEIKPLPNLWSLVAVFVVWSNIDPRMFVGLAVMLLWGLGDWIGLSFQRATLSAADRKHYWTVVAACIGGTLLNPSGWRALWAPVVLFGTENPAWRMYLGVAVRADETAAFPLFSSAIWHSIWLPILAGLVVVAAALVSLVLNIRRVALADVVLLLGMFALACFATHGLAVASLVACVVGGLNAQQWYRENCRQTYSIEFRELLFSRGGRAVTVIALFVLAVFSVNQRLFGTNGRRVGLGLSSENRTLIDGYRKALTETFDDRPFNLVPMQGDLMIWLDKKPFVDSRLSLFAGSGDDDLLRLHDQTRHSLTAEAAPSANGEWKSLFDRYKITHVVPRLWGAFPTAYVRILASRDFQLTHVGPVCAVLHRQESKDPEFTKYLEKHRLDFVKMVLRADSPSAELRTDWPRPVTFLQRYLTPRDPTLSPTVLEGAQWAMHLQFGLDRPSSVALAILAIRKANQGLGESPDQAEAYRVLADAYTYLDEAEFAIGRAPNGRSPLQSLRFYQTLGALYQALHLDPDNLPSRQRLIATLERQGKIDLALRELRELEQRQGDIADDPNADQMLRQQIQMGGRWQSQVDTLREQIEKALDAGEQKLNLAAQVYQGGFVLEALEMLKDDPEGVRSSPELQTLRGLMLFEAGDYEAAYRQFEYESDANPAGWRIPASWCWLARGDHSRALSLWTQHRRIVNDVGVVNMLSSLPLVQSPLAIVAGPWPTTRLNLVRERVLRETEEDSQLLIYTAMAQLESGRTLVAGKTLAGLLETNPETWLRPIVRFYLYLITEELIDLEPPSEWIPIDKDVFAPDEPTSP